MVGRKLKMAEVTISEQTKDFNFVLLGRDDGKKPIEKQWTKLTHRINDPILQAHIKAGKNYGIRCGSTSPVIIDGTSYSLIGIDENDPEHWDYIYKAILQKFGDDFMEVFCQTCTNYMKFTVFIRFD